MTWWWASISDLHTGKNIGILVTENESAEGARDRAIALAPSVCTHVMVVELGATALPGEEYREVMVSDRETILAMMDGEFVSVQR